MADIENQTGAGLTPVEKRFNNAAVDIHQNAADGDNIGFMPAGLCHVFFPYSDPGDQTDLWVRKHGSYILTMEATREMNPETEEMERFGLPFGARPRMMLALLNTLAISTKSPELHLGNSLTEFIGTFLKLDTNGRTIREIKNQMARLASADIKITYKTGATKDHTQTTRQRVNIIRDLDIWWSKSPNQRHLWGNNMRFSDDYFNALKEHGVPLDLRALHALSNKPMAIDLYSFLAHRLHFLDKPLFITWQSMKEQFGYTYKEMKTFKRDFRHCLAMVKVIYPDAKVTEDLNKGFVLVPSRPPVSKPKIFLPKTEYVIVPGAAAAKVTPKKLSTHQKNQQPVSGTKTVGEALKDLFSTIEKSESK